MPMAVNVAVVLGGPALVKVQVTDAPEATAAAVMVYPVGMPPCMILALLASVQLVTAAPRVAEMLLEP